MVKLWGKKKKNKDVTDEDDVGSGSDAEDMPLTERQEWQLILGEPDEILHTTSTSVNHRKKSIHMSHVVTPGSAVLHVDTSLKKTSSPVYTIPKIVRADLDEDRTFMSLFDKIELASGALLLPPTAYLLQYQLAESPLCINVDFKVHTQVRGGGEGSMWEWRRGGATVKSREGERIRERLRERKYSLGGRD